MMQGGYNLNTEFVKYFVLAATAPFWIPFMKKIWNEVQMALREEGGVFGRPPTPQQLEEIRRQKLQEEDPLINEPFVRGVQGPQNSGSNSPAANAGGPAAPPQTGFRSAGPRF